MRGLKSIFVIAFIPLLAGCMPVKVSGRVYYYEDSHAIYFMNLTPFTNVSKVKMDMQGNTLVFTKVSRKFTIPPISRNFKRKIAFNSLKVKLLPNTKYFKYEKEEALELSKIECANEVGIRKMFSFTFEVSPRKYPYVLK